MYAHAHALILVGLVGGGRAVEGVSQRVRVGLGQVLASRDPSPPAVAAAARRGQGLVP